MNKRQKGIKIMGKLIVLVKPLWHIMLLAVLLGTVGYLCAIFLTIIASNGVVRLISDKNTNLTPVFISLVVVAVSRGILHYGEQYCNHYIAFKLLGIVRHKIFAKLRELSPAKLEGKDKGNLISMITTDTELLEVFYAHTISPILIALVTSLFITIFIGMSYAPAGILALCGYLTVGVAVPLVNGKAGSNAGMKYRNSFGELNSCLLESLRGLDEILQYNDGHNRMNKINTHSKLLSENRKELNKLEGKQRATTNVMILFFSLAMLILMIFAYKNNKADIGMVIVNTVAMMGSFGPVVALSSLSNNLNQTLASGERVLNLLNETPVTEDVTNGKNIDFNGIAAKNVSFSYNEEKILSNLSVNFPKYSITGIYGKSGCGKSTLLKLLMRFWDTTEGSVEISNVNIRNVNTDNLRCIESYVTQETYIFQKTVAENIAIGKPNATTEEIIEAAKKASIHDFIMLLPKGYNTLLGELGNTISSGEKQRIGLARAFLHNSELMLLDEPTSNLDALNEGIILKSLHESSQGKTIIIVSHRESTLRTAQRVIDLSAENKL
ncbi:amino acid ABC transporter ATP-binding/permease protein [Oscillospiraceae bacterium LCP25S3_F9]